MIESEHRWAAVKEMDLAMKAALGAYGRLIVADDGGWSALAGYEGCFNILRVFPFLF